MIRTERMTMPERVKFWLDPKWLTLLLTILGAFGGLVWRQGAQASDAAAMRKDIDRLERVVEKVNRMAEDVAEIKGLLKKQP